MKSIVERNSNLELYRIICMLFIIAHHYVVNSGLTTPDGPLVLDSINLKSCYLWTIGMWGKTGINCFMLITGYFMCKSAITLRKFFKLILEIYFYQFIITFVFAIFGYESISIIKLIKMLLPFWGIQQNFTGCFIVFWLTIPFWNILVNNITKKQHQLLLIIALTIYTLLGSVPTFHVTFNYVTWFGIIYLIASYIRLYPQPIFDNKSFWFYASVLFIAIAILSMCLLVRYFGGNYAQFFVNDCNKIFAVIIATSTFLWFKNINLHYSRIINLIGGSTFGVFLIHTRSSVRKWIWGGDMFNCVESYNWQLIEMILYSIGVILLIFTICTIIDIIRIKYLEEPLFKFLDKKFPQLNKPVF